MCRLIDVLLPDARLTGSREAGLAFCFLEDRSEPGKRRCRFHGGLSTGPRTAEGKVRIAAAQRRRWAEWCVPGRP
jgi:hypothetical protein